MQIEHIKQYTKHGCNMSGNLVVVNYTYEWERHPRYGQFGSMAIYDALDDARKLLFSEYPDADELLSVPELVARI